MLRNSLNAANVVAWTTAGWFYFQIMLELAAPPPIP